MYYIIALLLGILIGVMFSKRNTKTDGILRLFGYNDPEGPYMRLELSHAELDQVIIKNTVCLEVIRDNPNSQK
jgi:hypothetical protein|nr:MAG TPA: Protein of unknown function (DUF3679) [Caudoviricetes sp.]